MTLKKNLTFRADDDDGGNVMNNGFVDPADVFFANDVEIVLQRSFATAHVSNFL